MSEPMTDRELYLAGQLGEMFKIINSPESARLVQRLLDEITRLKAREAELVAGLDSAKWILKKVYSLRSIGYNERHTEDMPNQTDETGTTLGDHRASAAQMEADIASARSKVEAGLRAAHR